MRKVWRQAMKEWGQPWEREVFKGIELTITRSGVPWEIGGVSRFLRNGYDRVCL
jgi:hypothetical protein